MKYNNNKKNKNNQEGGKKLLEVVYRVTAQIVVIVSWGYIYFQTHQVVYINYVQLFLSKKLKRGMYTGEN